MNLGHCSTSSSQHSFNVSAYQVWNLGEFLWKGHLLSYFTLLHFMKTARYKDVYLYTICENIGSISVAESGADVCAQASTWKNHQNSHSLRRNLRVCFEKLSSAEHCWTGSPSASAFPFLLCSKNDELLGPMSERYPGVGLDRESWKAVDRICAYRSWLLSHFLAKIFVTTLLRYNLHTIQLLL